MGRSLKKGPFADAHLLKKIEAQADNDKKTVTRRQQHARKEHNIHG